MRWIFDHAVRQEEREQAEGDVDEEDPVPVEVVGDPSAQGGANGRSDDNSHTVDGEGLPSFFYGEGVCKDGLLAGSEAAAACSLQDARDDQERKGVGDAAEKGAACKHDDAGHVEALASEPVGEPAGDGQDDSARDKIAGENPGGFLGACAQGACDVRQGDVGDGGVEHLHEGGKGDS